MGAPDFDTRQMMQQIQVEKAYKTVPNEPVNKEFQQVKNLKASVEVKGKEPDWLDKLYVYTRTIFPDWLIVGIFVIGLITLAIAGFRKQINGLILIWAGAIQRGSDDK